MKWSKLISILGFATALIAIGLCSPGPALSGQKGKLPRLTSKLYPPLDSPEPRASGSLTVEVIHGFYQDPPEWGGGIHEFYAIRTTLSCRRLKANSGPYPEGWYDCYRFNFATGVFELWVGEMNSPTGEPGFVLYGDSQPRLEDLDMSQMELPPCEVRNRAGQVVLKNY